MLEVNGVSKKFGELTVLQNVAFKVNKGEKLGIIGPNGAGKTTLFNIISGFLKPDSGSIRFNGKSIIGKKPNHIAKLGLVRTFQIIKVFENMTVQENLLTVSGDLSLLKNFGLWDKRFEPASNLSHGELRKLSLALAISTKPKMLLLDEPFSGLTMNEAQELADIISGTISNGCSIVIIEHRLNELFNLAERVIVLNSGKIIFNGSPEDAVRDNTVIEAYLGKKYARN
ncbi:ABC transporter ATP-binding protein [Archaeoglobales archaeon ex4484_92]|nr:MAG: ABC transporter ATP-binding protein [Archaeoglobales archaeon ex4484_92]